MGSLSEFGGRACRLGFRLAKGGRSWVSIQPAWQHISDAIWVYDLGRDVMVWANPAALDFWRANNLQELLEREFSANSDVTKGRLNDYSEHFANNEAIETG